MAEPGVPPFSGILNVAKPAGMTSHDVVNRVRRVTGQRRVGHAGTLDPDASGVLLVCLGAATRLSEYLMGGTKEYRATVRFGATSTTDDAAGEITPGTRNRELGTGDGENAAGSAALAANGAAPVSLTVERLQAVLPRFVGEIQQVPPAYAAIKVGGEPLYRRARAGQVIEVAPRTVRIDRIDVVRWANSDLTIDVTCSKGTYIRALARDLGQAVGTGAYLSSLVRTRSGQFGLDDAVTLEEIERAATLGYLDRLLHPPDAAVPDLPALALGVDAVGRLCSGSAWIGPGATPGQVARCYDGTSGRLIALARWDGSAWRPERVFVGSGME